MRLGLVKKRYQKGMLLDQSEGGTVVQWRGECWDICSQLAPRLVIEHWQNLGR